MKNLDRILVLVLAVGVWALVLKPTSLTAHYENDHRCEIDGFAEGSAQNGDAWIEIWNGVTVRCSH